MLLNKLLTNNKHFICFIVDKLLICYNLILNPTIMNNLYSMFGLNFAGFVNFMKQLPKASSYAIRK